MQSDLEQLFEVLINEIVKEVQIRMEDIQNNLSM